LYDGKAGLRACLFFVAAQDGGCCRRCKTQPVAVYLSNGQANKPSFWPNKGKMETAPYISTLKPLLNNDHKI